MNIKIIVLLAAIVTGLIVASSALYIVTEFEQVVITRFGAPVGDAVSDAGLHVKLPFVDQIHSFDKRFLEWDGAPNDIPTVGKVFIWVDTYARWRISDPLLFLETLQGNESSALSRLDDILDGETRNAIARNELVEVVRTSNREPEVVEGDLDESSVLETIETGRPDITLQIQNAAAPALLEWGIELMDFQFKRINYTEDVRISVYERMISERRRIASRYRSEGEGEAARIGGERERELQIIQSAAFREAEEMMGVADAEAAAIYAEAYSRDAGFYAFVRSMEAFETVIDPNTTLILSTDSELFRYLDEPR
jgi:membrane protease subunit HflC